MRGNTTSQPEPNAARDIRVYLERSGWFPKSTGDSGQLWGHERWEHTVAVPYRIPIGSLAWTSVAERVAAFEQASLLAVEQAFRYVYVDVTRLRAANEIVIARSIPLNAGMVLVSSAVAMVRAAATTAQKLKGDIGGGFSKIGDNLAATARLAHTEEGSYIVPVLIGLSQPPETLPGQTKQDHLQGLETTRNPYEPPERRVSRTLAEALVALHQNVVQPAHDVTMRGLHPFVEAGGSREIVIAVSRILEQEAVAEFEVNFDWATGVDQPVRLPAAVTIDARANELLKKAARLLREEKYSPAQLLSGPIVEVRHQPEDPNGEIAIQTVYRRRACEVRITVTAAEVDLANAWMSAKRVVLAEGEIRSTPGRPLRMRSPRRVQPLDETMLQMAPELG